MNQSTIDEFKLTNQGVRISMKKASPTVIAPVGREDPQEIIVQLGINEAAAALDITPSESVPPSPVFRGEKEEFKPHQIVSSCVGVFSGSSVKVGDKITAGSIVCRCTVEALGIVHEIKEDLSGELIEVLVEEGQLVEYGQGIARDAAKEKRIETSKETWQHPLVG